MLHTCWFHSGWGSKPYTPASIPNINRILFVGMFIDITLAAYGLKPYAFNLDYTHMCAGVSHVWRCSSVVGRYSLHHNIHVIFFFALSSPFWFGLHHNLHHSSFLAGNTYWHYVHLLRINIWMYFPSQYFPRPKSTTSSYAVCISLLRFSVH